MESGDAEDVGRPASIDIDGSFNDGAFADIDAARPANAFKHHVADLLVSALVDSEDLTPIIKAVYRLDDFLPVLWHFSSLHLQARPGKEVCGETRGLSSEKSCGNQRPLLFWLQELCHICQHPAPCAHHRV